MLMTGVDSSSVIAEPRSALPTTEGLPLVVGSLLGMTWIGATKELAAIPDLV